MEQFKAEEKDVQWVQKYYTPSHEVYKGQCQEPVLWRGRIDRGILVIPI